MPSFSFYNAHVFQNEKTSKGWSILLRSGKGGGWGEIGIFSNQNGPVVTHIQDRRAPFLISV